jgi:hypothetical protein
MSVKRLLVVCAAAALTATEGLGRVDVGCPETLSASDVVLLVNELFGASITLQDVSDEQREAGLLAAGVAAPIGNISRQWTPRRKGDFDSVTDIVYRLTGIPREASGISCSRTAMVL